LGLNRLKIYLAANISNPFFAPTLLFAELQIGSLMRRVQRNSLTLEAARQTELSVFGATSSSAALRSVRCSVRSGRSHARSVRTTAGPGV
jgi:hypothetical protein